MRPVIMKPYATPEEEKELAESLSVIKEETGWTLREMQEFFDVSVSSLSPLMSGMRKNRLAISTKNKLQDGIKRYEEGRKEEPQKVAENGLDHIQRASKHIQRAVRELKEAAETSAPLTAYGLKWFAGKLEQDDERNLQTLWRRKER